MTPDSINTKTISSKIPRFQSQKSKLPTVLQTINQTSVSICTFRGMQNYLKIQTLKTPKIFSEKPSFKYPCMGLAM